MVFLAQIKNSLDRAVYVSRIAKNAGISPQTVNTAVEGEISRQKKNAQKEEYRRLVAPRKEDSINPESIKLPREEKAERGIICYSFYNPDKLDLIEKKLSGGFVTAFNSRVFQFMKKSALNGGNLDFSLFNEEFSTEEMGRITGILNGFAAFAHDNEALEDYIKILNDYNEKKQQRDIGTMTDEQLREFAQRQKEKSK